MHCESRAVAPAYLEAQYKLKEYCVYSDINGKLWVRCDQCDCAFHLDCTRKSQKDVEEKRFLCSLQACEYKSLETQFFEDLK